MAIAMTFACGNQAKAADVLPAFSDRDMEAARAVPLYLVSHQLTVRPQVAYRFLKTPSVIGGPYQGMNMAQSVGVNVAGALVANLLINASEAEVAVRQAEDSWRWLQAGKCTSDADAPVRNALQEALRQSNITTVAQTGVLERRDLEDVVTARGERLVLQYSTSFTPGLSAVLTSVVVTGWGPADAKGKSQKSPRWANVLMSGSSPLILPAKTERDTALLLRTAEQAYADSGNSALIAKVNAAGHNADRQERQRAVDALRRHGRIMREAKEDEWTDATEPMRRAIYWTDDQCALQNQAVQDNAAEVGRLLKAMLSSELPDAKQIVEAPAFTQASAERGDGAIFDRPSLREVEAFTRSFHLSRAVGYRLQPAFFDSVLLPDADSR